MTLLQELNEQAEALPLIEALNEAIGMLDFGSSKFGRVHVKGARDFFKTNPDLVVGAAAFALGTFANYKTTQHNTIKLYAKDEYEKKMIRDVVDSLTTSGRFKIKKTHYSQSGQHWELIRS